MSQKSWEQRVTAFLLEAAEGLREIAQPSGNDSIKVQIGRAARRAGLSYWRAFDLWYRKARSVQAAEIEAIRTARAARTRERSHELACLAADVEALAERVSRLSADRWGRRCCVPGGGWPRSASG